MAQPRRSLYRQMLGAEPGRSAGAGRAGVPRAARGAAGGLATNAEPANVDFVLDRGGLRRYFRVLVDGHQVTRPKPDPEIYLRAAELLRVEPRNCIVFEDSYSGVEAARAAGTRIVGVRTTHAVLPGADLEIDDFHSPELEPWIREQVPEES